MALKFHTPKWLCINEKIEVNVMSGKEFGLNDVVEMKKQHPCGTNAWKVIRMGADIRIKCVGCGHSVMIPRNEFTKKIKKIIVKAEIEE